MTTDLDFITVERSNVIAPIVAELGFTPEGKDRQARDQAIMVGRRQEIDWDGVHAWARNEGVDPAVIAELREHIEAG